MPYIDSDKLNEAMYHEAFEKTSDLQKWDGGCWIRYKLYENVLKSIQPADVVEIVRCNDCKHRPYQVPAKYDSSGQCVKYGYITSPDDVCPFLSDDSWYNRVPEDDFFCGFGDRKDTEDGSSLQK